MARRTTWREKLADDKGLPQTMPIEGKMTKKWGEGTMVIPAPREVDELMKQVRCGQLATIAELRDTLARRHQTTIACPLTTGIFAWIAAHAAEETSAAGGKRITPYWRTLKSGGELNPKYPGGLEAQRAKLEAEGHQIVQRGKRWFVANYEERLARFQAISASKGKSGRRR